MRPINVIATQDATANLTYMTHKAQQHRLVAISGQISNVA
jgi:hypothetical protein